MNKFDELFGEKSVEKPKFELIEGSFGCDYCWEIMDNAEYYAKEKRLIYRHADHETIIEGFSL